MLACSLLMMHEDKNHIPEGKSQKMKGQTKEIGERELPGI